MSETVNTAAAPSADTRLSVSTVVNKAVEGLSKLKQIVLLVVGVNLVASLLMNFIARQLVDNVTGIEMGTGAFTQVINERSNVSNALLLLVLGIASLVITLLLQVALTRAGIEYFRGGKVMEWAEAWNNSKARVLTYVAVGVLTFLAVFVGFILLVVPGVILALMFAFGGVVAIDTNRGAVDSMKESAQLTKGHKGRLLLLFVVYILIAFLLGIVAGLFDTALSETMFANVVSDTLTTLLSCGSLLGIAYYYSVLRPRAS